MIELKTGNILENSAYALVNPVNCYGAMGAGLAREFRRAYPRMYDEYLARCADEEVRIGELTTFDAGDKLIINFPTKNRWEEPSRLEYITEGLPVLRRLILAKKIESIAIPALGCGLGGLPWDEVQPQICAALAFLKGVQIDLYAPHVQPRRNRRR